MKNINGNFYLLSPTQDVRCNLVSQKHHAHLDLLASVICRHTSALYRPFLKDHAGNLVVLLNTVFLAKLTLVCKDVCNLITLTWYLNIEKSIDMINITTYNILLLLEILLRITLVLNGKAFLLFVNFRWNITRDNVKLQYETTVYQSNYGFRLWTKQGLVPKSRNRNRISSCNATRCNAGHSFFAYLSRIPSWQRNTPLARQTTCRQRLI